MGWRNGGGWTREVFVWPQSSDLDTFAWRVSIASIERNGAFSRFAHVMRTAVLIDGAGVRLRSGARSIELAQPCASTTFDGAAEWHCELLEGPVHLFNVMVRRPLTAQVKMSLDAPVEAPSARYRVAYAAHHSASVRLAEQRCELAEGDACIAAGDRALPLSIRAAGPHGCALIVLIDGPAVP